MTTQNQYPKGLTTIQVSKEFAEFVRKTQGKIQFNTGLKVHQCFITDKMLDQVDKSELYRVCLERVAA